MSRTFEGGNQAFTLAFCRVTAVTDAGRADPLMEVLAPRGGHAAACVLIINYRLPESTQGRLLGLQGPTSFVEVEVDD
jgi:hypothetical protein